MSDGKPVPMYFKICGITTEGLYYYITIYITRANIDQRTQTATKMLYEFGGKVIYRQL